MTEPVHARDAAEAVALLEEIVSIPSPSGQEQDVARSLAGWMARLGLSSHIDEAGNAIGVRSGPPTETPTRDIILLGHMDTYPGMVPLRRKGDLFFGRGSVDAKGPLAAFVIATSRITPPPGVRIIVAGAVEEESATSRGARHIARSYRPAACIIGEPSAWDGVTIGYKGRLLATFRATRPCSHSAGPGETAPELAVNWFNAVRAHFDTHNRSAKRVFDQVQVGLRSIQSESDGLHEWCEAHLGFRLPPGIEPHAVEATCRELASGGEVTCTGHEVAILADRANLVARSLVASIRDAGAIPKLRVKTGTSDMNVVAPVWNCPIAAYGPGDSALDHTPDEHISIAEYLRSIDVLAAALRSMTLELAAATADARTETLG